MSSFLSSSDKSHDNLIQDTVYDYLCNLLQS